MNERWLVAADLAGSLFDHSLLISRMYRAARPFAQALAIDQPLICYQGALTRSDEETLAHWAVPLPLAREVLEFAATRDIATNIYIDDRLFVAEHREENAFYASLSRGVTIEAVGPLLEFMDQPPTKIVLIQQEQEVPALLEDVTARWGAVAQVVRSHLRFVELTHPAASKGNALHGMADALGIPGERTLAVGDNLNDLSMVQAAGIGIAMGNADPALKAQADWVAPPLHEDGFAVAVERFLLQPAPTIQP